MIAELLERPRVKNAGNAVVSDIKAAAADLPKSAGSSQQSLPLEFSPSAYERSIDFRKHPLPNGEEHARPVTPLTPTKTRTKSEIIERNVTRQRRLNEDPRYSATHILGANRFHSGLDWLLDAVTELESKKS